MLTEFLCSILWASREYSKCLQFMFMNKVFKLKTWSRVCANPTGKGHSALP